MEGRKAFFIKNTEHFNWTTKAQNKIRNKIGVANR
jgi:hypothetical protein